MATSIPLQLAETIQTAHIRQNPSALLDTAPSTAADRIEAVVLEDLEDLEDEDEDEDGDEDEDEDGGLNDGGIDEKGAAEGDDDDDILPYSYSAIRPWRPHHDHNHDHDHGHGRGLGGSRFGHQLPALPDLRFEQSYLRSVAKADRWWKVALITARDQVVMPFTQGLLYNLAVCGWQFWNRNAQLGGQTVGARVRRWWYGVNNWPLQQNRKAWSRR